MKQNAAIIFSIITSLAFGQSNVYHPFPENAAIWNIHYNLFCAPNNYADEDYSFVFDADTTINNQNYHQISTTSIVSNSVGNCGGIQLGYQGAIRQDIALKKVFFIPPFTNTEQLLYDFTLQVGDTIQGYLSRFGLPETVQSIDSVLVGQDYRKRWNINSYYTIQFIEGIGSTYGLIEALPGTALHAGNFSIGCFQLEQNILYPDTPTNCKRLSAISQNNLELFQVYPNPFEKNITISSNSYDFTSLLITDLSGKVMLPKQTFESGTHMKSIPLNHLAPGIYILSIENNSTHLRSNHRIIKL